MVSINVLGTLYPLQAAWRHMLARGYGRVVLSGSTVGIYGAATRVAAYGATRAGVIGLARSLTQELADGADIGVNIILPLAYTPMSEKQMPEGRALRPELVAPVVGWLCSEQNRHRGQIFHASGLKVTRVGIAESAPVVVDPDHIAVLSDQSFGLEPIFEPATSGASVEQLLT